MKATMLLRSLVIASMTSVGVVAIVLACALTNWFRYPLSLEASYVLLPVVGISGVGIVLHIWALRTLGQNKFVLCAAITSLLLVVFTTGALTKEAFGSWMPTVAANHIDRNGDQVIRSSDGTAVVYHLELHNPFATTATTYLIGTLHDRSFKVDLPIGRVAGYGDPIVPSDWVTLTQTSAPHIFAAKVSVDPSHEHHFLVDLDRQVATRVN
jgi:hypothetical protein